MGKNLKGKELGQGITQRKDGIYQARYSDRWGKRKTIYGSDLQKLRIDLAVAISDNENMTSVRGEITLDKWFLKWMEIYKSKSVRPNTQREYTHIYSENGGFRNETGSLPDKIKVIGYKQHFKIPYVGLTGNYRYDNFEFGGALKYSGWVRGSDNDEHYVRQTTFRSKVKNQNYYSVAVNAGYYITPEAKLYIEGVWSRLTNKKGDTSLYDRSDNTSEYNNNGAGIENYNFITTAGLKYTF